LKLEGTDFQINVWEEIKKIPKGSVKTYKEIANILGNPKSARAVANACGRNPYLPIIPCHRVIRSDRYLGGYSGKGGVEKKKELLINEGFHDFKI
jgi:methylated-DNA-[protein]-cysteine S-methyltransferase